MGRIVDGLKQTIKNITGVDVEGDTKGAVLNDFVTKSTVIPLTVNVADTSGPVSGATITVKTGNAIGSGTAVQADSDGTYPVKLGMYNYSISKVGYTAKSGTIEVTAADVEARNKSVTVELTASV